ncbi:MAG TPA: RsmD family RNA methyltransferase [Actinomycetota bacterium]
MRVIAGAAKGTRLAPVPEGTRPLSDRAREGLFSSLGAAVVDAVVFDLYAGTGAVGIEALSRGAAHATFVDRSPGAVRTIRANLERTHLAGPAAEVRRAEVGRFLLEPGRTARVALLDPPYDTPVERIERQLALLGEKGLSPGWTVALTRPRKSSNVVIPVHFAIARQLEYGDSLVVLYREV